MSKSIFVAAAACAVAALGYAPLACAQSIGDIFRQKADEIVNQTVQQATDQAVQGATDSVQQGGKKKKKKQQQDAGATTSTPAAEQTATTDTGAGAATAAANLGPTSNGPVPIRTKPTVAWEAKLGFRDWGDTVAVANGTVVGYNSTNKGGLYAVDAATGQLRWKVLGEDKPSEVPVTDGNVVVVPVRTGSELAAYTLAAGKPVWRKPFTLRNGSRPLLVDGKIIAQHTDGNLYALDPATGAERWKYQYASGENGCTADLPAVADGIVYFSSGERAMGANPRTDYSLHAVDTRTGQELWRYHPLSRYPDNYGVCLVEIVAAGDTVVAVGDSYIYGVDRASGRQRYRLDTRDNTNHLVDLHGLVQTGGSVFASSSTLFWAIDAHSGRTQWTLPGKYRDNFPGTAAANGVVYFQGTVEGVDTGPDDGHETLHAVDVRSQRILWSFKDASEVPWAFDVPLALDGTIYVTTHKTLLKLQ